MRVHHLLFLGLIAAIVLAAADARAGCTIGGIQVYPAPKVALPANGRLVLEGSGNMADAAFVLADGALVLASAHEQIPLRVAGRTRGSWNVAQVILVPARDLPEGALLSLRASTAAQGSAIDAELRRRAPAWTTTARLDAADVHWTARPAPRATEIGSFCPRYAYVPIRVPVDHPERLLGVIAEVTPVRRGGVSSRFLMPVYEGEIALGNLGCSAPIGLEPGFGHWVTLTAVDLAGHEIKAQAPVAILYTDNRHK